MSEQATAWVTLIPSARGFGSQTERALDAQLPQVGDRQGKKLGSRISTGLGAALKSPVGLATIGVVGGLAAGGIKAAKAFEEAESVGRKLNTVLGNMGRSGATESVEKLASALQRKTGVDDEVIKSGQTVLATFSEVAKSAGKVGGTFDRATRAAVDLAAAGFGDVHSASLQLGKALQDPIKGVTALGRAGVTFTATQKDQIKNFVETNQLAKAQEIVLKEVEHQVKGTAEAGVKGSDRMKSAFGEVQESIGGLLADLFDSGKGKKSFIDQAATATFNLSGEITKFQSSKDWKELRTTFRDYGSDVKTVAGALSSVVSNLNDLSKKTTGQGLLHWLGEIHDKLGPLSTLAKLLNSAEESWKFLAGKKAPVFKGSSSKELNDLLLGGPLERASGGPAVGLTLVGERGPELLSLPAGSYVHSNAESQRMLNGPVKAAGQSASDRPIRMADGTLFGWVRSIANGEAELVLNQAVFAAGTYGAAG